MATTEQLLVVTLTNWCLPSLIYGRLHRPRAAKTAT